MIHITSLDDGLELFKALGSDIRIQILKILLENNQMSMNQIANELNISNGALTGHIKKLEETVLIQVLRPPFRGEHSAYISIVTGRGPGADQSVIYVKAYITWPVVVDARSLRTYLG